MSEAEISKGSVSGWISQMRTGDPIAIGSLVTRYFGKLAQYANSKLRRGIRVTDDGEDIANSVLEIVTRCTSNGRYPNLQDRDDLWFLMIAIAQNKVIDSQRTELRRERKVASTHTMTDMLETYNMDLEKFLSNDEANSPLKLMEIVDCWEEQIKNLPDGSREVARLKMDGYNNREISDKLGMLYRTVDRKVQLIVTQLG